MDQNGSDSAAIIDVMERLDSVETVALRRGDGNGVEVLAVPKGKTVQSMKPLLDEYLKAPERRRGTARLSTLLSFIAHVNRCKDEHSAIFADVATASGPKLIGVLNYNEKAAGAHGKTPWDVPDEWLVTLCEPCHERTTSLIAEGRGVLQTLNQEELHVVLAFIRTRRLLAGFNDDFPITLAPEADGVGAGIGLPWRTVAAACKGGGTISRELIQRLQREAGLPVAGGD